jgi:hypothetical protein
MLAKGKTKADKPSPKTPGKRKRDEEQTPVVTSVTGWRVNHETRELEWRVCWEPVKVTWELNSNSTNYQSSVYDFVRKTMKLPRDYPTQLGTPTDSDDSGDTLVLTPEEEPGQG